MLTEFGFRHQATGMREQRAQKCQGARPQGNDVCTPPQAAMRFIDTKRAKGDVVLLLHGDSCSLSLNSI